MNKLTIAKEINIPAGTQGEIDTVKNLRGFQKVLISFLDDAYLTIQNYRTNWEFMRKYVKFSIDGTPLTGNQFQDVDVATVNLVTCNFKKIQQITFEDFINRQATATPSRQPEYYTYDPYIRAFRFNEVTQVCILDMYYH